MSNELEKSNAGVPAKNIQELLKSDMVKNRLQEILGKRSSVFATSLIQISNSNDMLAKADPTTLLNAALLATTLDLPINNALGQAYIVPFNNRKKGRVEAQFQIGYKGLKNLAIRSGQFKELISKEVYEGQVVEDDSFLGYHFDWKAKESNKVIGYASYFKLISGFESTLYMTVEEVDAHAKRYSQTYKQYGSGLWKDDFDKMALKTISKLHLNSGEAPLSVEMRSAVTADQSVVNDFDGQETIDVEYVDNTNDKQVNVNKPTTEDIEFLRFKEFLSAKVGEDLVQNITLDDVELIESFQDVINDITTQKELVAFSKTRENNDLEKALLKSRSEELKSA